MDKNQIQNLINAHTGKPFDMVIKGFSMQPVLFENDSVIIQPHTATMQYDDYNIGDLLAFKFNNDGILIHRLLLKENGKYYCKGDNAFRVEGVYPDSVIGKVISVNGKPLPLCTPRLIALSYAVNQQFVQLNKKIDLTKETDIYKLYEKLYLGNIQTEEDCVIYQRNTQMEYTLSSDGTTLVASNFKSVLFVGEREADILELLLYPRTLDNLLLRLCETYDVAPYEVKENVEKFLDTLIQQGIVVAL